MYAPQMGKPVPMLADYRLMVVKITVHVAQVEPVIASLIVMVPRDDHWFVENIAVDPLFQGKGLGTKLMTFAESDAVTTRLPTVKLPSKSVTRSSRR